MILADRAAVVAAIVFTLLVLASVAAPLYAEHVAETTPYDNHITDQVSVDGEATDVVSVDGIPVGPTWGDHFMLGADPNGRDLAVRLLYGARVSLEIAAGSVAITLVLAIAVGLLAGYLGGRVDSFVGRTLDVLWSFPALMLAAMLGTALSLGGVQLGPLHVGSGSPLIPIFVIGLVYVPYVARPVRGQVMALSNRPFVDAARGAGFSTARVVFSELLPHLWSTVLVLGTLSFVNAVILESALSFLGAGVAPPEPSIGKLIADGIDAVGTAPHLLLVPCAWLVVMVLSLSVMAEGLRRVLDPHGSLPGRIGGGR